MGAMKTMLLGIVIILLGVGLAEPGIDTYLFKTLTFIPTSTFTSILPLVSLGLILVGVILAIVGLFLRSTSRSPF